MGKTQLLTYFENTFSYLSAINLINLEFPAIQNDTILVTYTEQSTVLLTNLTYTLPVTVIFTFNSQSLNSYIDIFQDSASIADAFCFSNQTLSCKSSTADDNLIDTYHFTIPNIPNTWSSIEQANYQTLLSYLTYLASGNIPAAVNLTSHSVIYTMHAFTDVVPVAGGIYMNQTGATNFFINTSSEFSSFTLQNPFIRALTNNTAIVTFLEVSTTKSTAQSYQQVNAIIYTFDSMNLILSVDIWFNSIIVGEALQCKPGTVLVCSNSLYGKFLSYNLIMGLVMLVCALM